LKGQATIAEAISGLITIAEASEANVAVGIAELSRTKSEIQRLLEAFDTEDFNPPEATASDVVKSARAIAAASAGLASSGDQVGGIF
jgi:hypothetical protein